MIRSEILKISDSLLNLHQTFETTPISTYNIENKYAEECTIDINKIEHLNQEINSVITQLQKSGFNVAIEMILKIEITKP